MKDVRKEKKTLRMKIEKLRLRTINEQEENKIEKDDDF